MMLRYVTIFIRILSVKNAGETLSRTKVGDQMKA